MDAELLLGFGSIIDFEEGDKMNDAISRPPVKQEPCEDAISRQAVLDYIDKMPSKLTADGRRMIRRRTLEEYISDTLPSVTQEPKILDKIRAEIADLDDADYDYEGYYKAVTDAVKIIDKYTGKPDRGRK